MMTEDITIETTWKNRYHAALLNAQRAVDRPSRVACGFTNNVDFVVQVESEMLAPFRTLGPELLTGDLPETIQTPADLANTLLHCVRRGIGGEVQIANAAMNTWMRAHFDGPMQIGGTGARAANTLAFLGFNSVMHVTGLSALEAELHESSGRLTVATGQDLLPPKAAARAASRGDDPMFHFIFEYQAGTALDFGAVTVIPSDANRIITSYDPLNLRVELDPAHLAAIEAPHHDVDCVLISGFNQMEGPQQARDRIALMAEWIPQWRASHPVFIHLELAAIRDPAIRAAILGTLVTHVDSLGLNADEIHLLDDTGVHSQPYTAAGCLDILTRFKTRTGLKRVNLHTQSYCLTVTDFDPQHEQTALLFAALVSGTRAATGRYPSLAMLETSLETLAVRDDAQFHTGRLGELCTVAGGIERHAAGWVVCIPTLNLEHPVTTVGLGDTYTGGLLAMLRPANQ